MVIRYDNDQGAQALDINQFIDTLRGYAWVNGGEAFPGDGAYELVIEPLTVLIGGNEQPFTIDPIDLSRWFVGQDAAEEPRKLIIGINSEGGTQVVGGEPASPSPPDYDNPFDTNQPAPPDLYRDGEDSGPMVVLYEIWVGEDAQQLRRLHIRDRRMHSAAIFNTIWSGDLAIGDTLTDPSGKTIGGEVASIADIPSAAEIIEASSEKFFSGLHTDLEDDRTTTTWETTHHTPPTDSDFQDAAKQLEIIDLGTASAQPGEYLSDSGWQSPPQLEAPVVASSDDSGRSTITHTGGGSTDFTIEGVTSGRASQLLIAFGEAGTTGLSSEDHGWDSEWNRDYIASRNETDLKGTFTWEERSAPASDESVEVSYTVFEASPTAVDGRWSASDTLDAISGQAIDPSSVYATDAFQVPSFDDIGNYPSTYLGTGSKAVATGNNANWASGEYVYIGGQWLGPFSAGVSSISQLEIDADKNWNNKRIYNVTSPTEPGDVVRLTDLNSSVNSVQQDLDDHKGSGTAHQAAIKSQHTTLSERALSLSHSGGVRDGESAYVGTKLMNDGDTMLVERFELFVDGAPAPSGINVLPVIDGAAVLFDGGREYVIEADGSKVIAPVTNKYTNTSGSDEIVSLVVDNGEFGSGSGSDRGIQITGYAQIV